MREIGDRAGVCILDAARASTTSAKLRRRKERSSNGGSTNLATRVDELPLHISTDIHFIAGPLGVSVVPIASYKCATVAVIAVSTRMVTFVQASGEPHLQMGLLAWDRVRGTVLLHSGSPHLTGPRGGGADDPVPRRTMPRARLGRRRAGAQECLVLGGGAWHIACERSGNNSSIRRAGWVLIRSSTSRR